MVEEKVPLSRLPHTLRPTHELGYDAATLVTILIDHTDRVLVVVSRLSSYSSPSSMPRALILAIYWDSRLKDLLHDLPIIPLKDVF